MSNEVTTITWTEVRSQQIEVLGTNDDGSLIYRSIREPEGIELFDDITAVTSDGQALHDVSLINVEDADAADLTHLVTLPIAHPTISAPVVAPPHGWGPYHLRFTNFDRTTIDATDGYFGSNPWKGDKLAKAQRWVDTVAGIYGMDAPTVAIVDPGECSGMGCYVPATNQILLPKVSVTTLFHEFRHAMQHSATCTMVEAIYGDSRHEEDARAWSLSLFWIVRPERFATMVASGRILYVPANSVVTS